MMNMKNIKRAEAGGGFTLIEIIIVVIILGIAAMMAVPMLSSAADMQVRAAANRIAADLEYAKSMAITHQKTYSVEFDTANESYQILDSTGTVIANPVRPSEDYAVDFSTDSNTSRVNIATAVFNTVMYDTVTFDYLGSPYAGTGTGTSLNLGKVTLQADDFSIDVEVEPMTGYVTITSP